MCGIFLYKGNKNNIKSLSKSFDLIKYRGPDNSRYNYMSKDIFFAFHRLAIMGISSSGNQPMYHPEDNNLSLICNGEIYNYKELAEKYNFLLKTGSDCEVILFMYKRFGIEKTVKELDGVFMFILYDAKTDELFSARDPFGVRPGFIGLNKNEIFISSEFKSICKFCKNISPFKPGTWWNSNSPDKFNQYFKLNKKPNIDTEESIICDKINYLLTQSVKKRLMAEREIGCLLSGGLDSSLIASLVSKYYNCRETLLSRWNPAKFSQVIFKRLKINLEWEKVDAKTIFG